MHIETIEPNERLHPSLGGTGYLPPRNPSSVTALFRAASEQVQRWPSINRVVWKVARSSVQWHKGPHRKTRRLRVGGKVISCDVIGGVRDWWFVAADASLVVEKLTVR